MTSQGVGYQSGYNLTTGTIDSAQASVIQVDLIVPYLTNAVTIDAPVFNVAQFGIGTVLSDIDGNLTSAHLNLGNPNYVNGILPNANTTATTSSTPNTIVLRDGSGTIPGSITTPGTTTLNAISKWANTLGSALADTSVIIDSSNNVTTAGYIKAGAFSGTFTTVSTATPHTITNQEHFILCDTTTFAISIVLPAISGTQGFFWVIKDIAGNAFVNNVTISTTGGEDIDNQLTWLLINNYQEVTIMSDGIQFYIIDEYLNASGPVTGPGSTTVTAIARWANTGGTALSNSGILIDSSNHLTTPGSVISGGYAGGVVTYSSGAHTALTTQHFINCDTSGATIGIVLPTPSTHEGYWWKIKDIAGNASVNNITISAGGLINIDDYVTWLIDTNYQELTVMSDGTQYYVISEYGFQTNSYTPTIGDGTNNFTMSSQVGFYFYTNQGRNKIITINSLISWTSKGLAVAGSGVKISLPYPVSSAQFRMVGTPGTFTGINPGSGAQISVLASSGSSEAFVSVNRTDGSPTDVLLVSDCNTSGTLEFTAVYTIDS